MADAPPFPEIGTTVQCAGATMTVAPPSSRFSLRGRDAKALSGLIGHALPAKIGDANGGVAKLGPDEWYAVLPEGEALPNGDGEKLSVVDVSSRAVGLVIEGEGAAQLLMAGCPLDLESMKPGRATRTVFETVEIVLFRETATRFRVEVWRSFAPWLWTALSVAR